MTNMNDTTCEARGTDYGLSGLRHSAPDYRGAEEEGAHRHGLATPQEERVARAICEAAVGLRTPPYVAQFVEAHWPNHIPGARAAIAAYPDPPKVKPVEGDEVAWMDGAQRRVGNLIAVRKRRPSGPDMAWVEGFNRSEARTYYTVFYSELERA